MRQLWAAFKTLEDKANDDSGKPAYFRFLTLLGFKIFLETQVDVAILEVGLGGRLDATNCVREPVVCGVTPLGFDHMDLLGHTLPEIAREKAGIFKPTRPAFTSPQREDAAKALQEVAERVGTPLDSARPLDEYKIVGGGTEREVNNHVLHSIEDLKVGLSGAHQRENAALAVRLAAEWEALSGKGGEKAQQRAAAVQRGELPVEYIAGLESVQWPGRGQIVEDYEIPVSSRLTFFLDGAHTAESMATCGRWFADVVENTTNTNTSTLIAAAAAAAAAAKGTSEQREFSSSSHSVDKEKGNNGVERLENGGVEGYSANEEATHRVLVFNCMQERDPTALLQPLISTLNERGALPAHALFVPPDSTYMKLGKVDEVPDLAWQLNLRQVYETMQQQQQQQQRGKAANFQKVSRNSKLNGVLRVPPLPSVLSSGVPAVQDATVGAVLPSLQHTIDWLRKCVRESPKIKMQVLVTGSLYLVGDMLKILGNSNTSLNTNNQGPEKVKK